MLQLHIVISYVMLVTFRTIISTFTEVEVELHKLIDKCSCVLLRMDRQRSAKLLAVGQKSVNS